MEERNVMREYKRKANRNKLSPPESPETAKVAMF